MTCPVCGNAASISDVENYFAMFINCPLCGHFFVESDLFKESVQTDGIAGAVRKLPLRTRASMYYYLTQMQQPDSRVVPHFHNNSQWGEQTATEDNNHQFISLKSLDNIFPKNINEQADMALLNLAGLSDYCGHKIVFENNTLKKLDYLFFLKPLDNGRAIKEQLDFFDALLKEMNYAQQTNSVGNARAYTVTAHGWSKVAEIKARTQQTKQAFIAMWFHNSMSEARKQIIEAIESCGYIASIIDMKEHNNQIVPEIFYEIRNSRFVVTDITGQRGGVYYEAGYAEALGLPVIMCCKKDDFANAHFDVKQKSAIIWEDEVDLHERLKKRIKSTVGTI